MIIESKTVETNAA